MGIKATDVFVPGSYPQHTYVARKAEALEEMLRDALSTPGQVVSLSGPSKSGKTVLVERVVGRDLLIPISGASLRAPEDVWQRALDWMDVPSSTRGSRTYAATLGSEVTAKGGIEIKFLAKGEAGGTAKGEVTGETSTEAVRADVVLHEVAVPVLIHGAVVDSLGHRTHFYTRRTSAEKL